MRKTWCGVLAVGLLTACGDFWPWVHKDKDGSASPGPAGATFTRAPHATSAEGLPPAIAQLKDGEIVDDSGNAIALRGFSWFGLNVLADDGGTSLHGLWNQDPMASDFATVVWRQKALGFNAVRLPFSFSLFAKQPKSWVFDCQAPDAAAMGAATKDPEHAGDVLPPPVLAHLPARTPGKCNDYLPSSSVRDQVLYIIKFYVDNGFYVLADNHFREDNTAADNQSAWVDGWKALAKDLDAYPSARGRVLFDLLNEPGQKGVNWDRLGPMYLAAMEGIWSVTQKFPFLIEGTGQEGLGANWGDGYATDPGQIAAHGLSDPNPFFTALAGKPYAQWVVLGPHVYGPAVTNAPDRFSGDPLFARLYASFGALQAKGLTINGKTTRFPVAIGEFGSKFEDPRDLAFMRDFASYLNHKDGAAARDLRPIVNWFYWDWNADSGDTGGLVADDWKSLQWTKLRYLNGLGLAPWYAAPIPVPKASSPAPSAAPEPAKPAPAQSEPAPSSAPAKPSLPQPTPVTLPAMGGAMAQQGKGPPVDCHVKAFSDASWKHATDYFGTINVFFTPLTGSTTPVPFTLEIANPAYREVQQAWNMEDFSVKDGVLHGTVKAPWASLVPGAHNVVNIGYIVRGVESDMLPHSVTINGHACQLESLPTR